MTETPKEVTSLVQPLIPNDYQKKLESIKKGKFSLFDFYKEEIVFSITVGYYKSDEEAENECNTILKRMIRPMTNQLLMVWDEDEVKEQFQSIMTVIEHGGNPDHYLPLLMSTHLMFRLGMKAGNDVSIRKTCYEYKTKEGFQFQVFYVSTNSIFIQDVHIPALEALRKKLCNYKGKPVKRKDPVSPALRHECFKRDNYRCIECGATNKEKTLHADHKLPVSQGGTNELSNLQTLCDDCNFNKHNRSWVAGNGN